ncbi:MAG: hypothetical protein HZB38_02215 [Planctomycetes bacterium]|nr:hypothetical protein [Planctomycetota bacterium]
MPVHLPRFARAATGEPLVRRRWFDYRPGLGGFGFVRLGRTFVAAALIL